MFLGCPSVCLSHFMGSIQQTLGLYNILSCINGHQLQYPLDVDVHLLFYIDLDQLTCSLVIEGHVQLEFSWSILTDAYTLQCPANAMAFQQIIITCMYKLYCNVLIIRVSLCVQCPEKAMLFWQMIYSICMYCNAYMMTQSLHLTCTCFVYVHVTVKKIMFNIKLWCGTSLSQCMYMYLVQAY